MAVTRKQTKNVETNAVDVEALILKGGSVAGDTPSMKKTDVTAVILRIPADVLVKIEESVLARRVKIPRHTWLLEAVMEKLDREDATS